MDAKQIDVMVADASHEVYVDKILDKLVLTPINSWGDDEKIPIISFDFN